jgi:hypothetical protein
MKHDLEKRTKHGRVSSCEYEFYYSSFTDIVSITATWANINEKERVAIPAEKIDELIDFLEKARFMYRLGLPTEELFPGTLDELNELGGINE